MHLLRIAGYAWLAAAALPLPAAVIRGVVLDQQTGRFLARASVSLKPVAGTAGEPRTARTGQAGQFEFGTVAAGAYVIRVARRGFMSMEHGQKRWNSAGVPLAVAADASPFLTIRLPRFSGITGTVVDENEVGLPDIEVLAYRPTNPPTLVSRGLSDDRGIYRIPGLTPGAYLVRSAAGRGEAADYLPTFSREAQRVEDARPVDVALDDDARSIDVRPLQGRLFTLSGLVSPAELPVGPINVTLASDMGRQSARGPEFQFHGLPPGAYEVYAEAQADRATGARFQSGFTRIQLGGDTAAPIRLSLADTRFECMPPLPPATPVRVLVRRLDLAGAGSPVALDLRGGRTQLGQGRWEVRLQPPDGQYVSSITGASRPSMRVERPDGWNEVEVRPFTFVRFGVSSGAATLRGVVKNGGEPVAGAPVYLEAYDPTYRKRLLDLVETRTDLRGQYQFADLAPGAYRILATFEYRDPAPAIFDQAQAPTLRIEAKGNQQLDLTLWELR